MDHKFLVTEIYPDPVIATRGKIKCVHYSLPRLFGTRIIAEDDFEVDLNTSSVQRLNCGPMNTYSAEEVVCRARKRIGERKWNLASNRSDHFCHWAKMDLRQSQSSDWISTNYETGINTSKSLSSLLIETREVHLMEEIQPGDVVQFKGASALRDKGIIVHLRDIREGRKFHIGIIMLKSNRVKLVADTINLDRDKLFLKRYHHVHCHPKLERVRRAYAMKDQNSSCWTQLGFIEECIMINE